MLLQGSKELGPKVNLPKEKPLIYIPRDGYEFILGGPKYLKYESGEIKEP